MHKMHSTVAPRLSVIIEDVSISIFIQELLFWPMSRFNSMLIMLLRFITMLGLMRIRESPDGVLCAVVNSYFIYSDLD